MFTETENGMPTVFVPQDGVPGNRRSFPLNNSTRTVLSSFDTIDFPHVLAAKEEMKSWKFLQLDPTALRKPTPKDGGDDTIDSSGNNLAAALFRIKQEDEYQLTEISRKLQLFLPNFIKVDVIDDKENKQFVIKLLDKENKEYTSRVLSEGTLRLLALCILEFDKKHSGLLCFEEPENGIHPQRIKDMLALLKNLSTDFLDTENPLRQVIVNTHSPILVGDVYRWKQDSTVLLLLAKMNSRVTDIAGQRRRFKVTAMDVAMKEYNTQLPTWLPTEKSPISISEIQKYLKITQNEE